MKSIKIFTILCVAVVFATSCRKDVDMTLVQKTVLENADIREIEVEDAWQVTVVYDSINTFVDLEYSAYLEPYLKAKMEGTKLEIGFSGIVRPAINSAFRATVHTDKIEKIEADDASELQFTGHFTATSDDLSIRLEEASVCNGLDYSGHDCKVAIEDASQLLGFRLTSTNSEVSVSDASTCKGVFYVSSHFDANLSGASRLITLDGAASFGSIKLQDASLLNMAQTEVGTMHVDLSGASEATVNVSDSMEGSLTDASTLFYKGHPQLNVDCSDDSQVIPL
ncbi:MAG: DUF2807 domain-containing protein [Bacteroidales bacterium]|nr:DUF2807 domain-containing protein [Bacteroidales bacterium]